MDWIKKGFIFRPKNECGWWHSHVMAPTAVLLNDNTIRVFCGCWDDRGISRIGYVDLSSDDPTIVTGTSASPVLDVGAPGCFDDNGVFPGHATKVDDTILLHFTGFQLLEKIQFSNFGGLAVSHDNGESFERVSEAPVLDRADEGLFTRAGASILEDDGLFRACYSAGSEWEEVAGKARPVYEVFYQESLDGRSFSRSGTRIVGCDRDREHGLGRPQITKIDDIYYVFYTRRSLDFRYHLGVSRSRDCIHWERCDEWLSSITHGLPGEFDSDMVYFPSVLNTGSKIFLFYCGNGFGKEGFGYAELSR